jgi:hypothetical protein
VSEIIAEVGVERGIDLIVHQSGKASRVGSMTPGDGAYLARAMLACAAALCGQDPPPTGTVIPDAQLPIMKWSVGASSNSGRYSVLVLTVPPGIELTFRMPGQGAKEIGAALIAQGGGPAKSHSGTIR